MNSNTPKVLHPIGGRALIGHVLDMAQALSPRQIHVVVGKDMDTISAAVAPVPSLVQDPPLGTGHAVQCAREALAGFTGDVVVLYGDTPLIKAQTVQKMRDDAGGASVVVLGFRPEDPAAYGRLVMSADNTLEAIVEYADATDEQKAITLCNSGVMLLDSATCWDMLDALNDDNASGEYYLTDLVEIANTKGGRCVAVEAEAEEVLGVNSRVDLAIAEAVFQERARMAALESGVTLQDPDSVYFSYDTHLGRDVTVGPNVVFGPQVRIADNVTIEAFCHIEGADVASGARIGPFARLRPGASLGEDVHIGNFVEVKNSRIDDGAKANHLTYIGDSHIGAATNIGAGTITANYDGFNKHKTEIGAGVSIGSNVVLVAPLTVADGALVGAGSTISENVATDDLVVTRAERKDVPDGAARFRASRAKKL